MAVSTLPAHRAPAKLAGASTQLARPLGDEFDLSGLQIFTSVPEHRDFGVVALRGMVAVYDEGPIHREGILEGAFYVRESQRPAACMTWSDWLQRERDECGRRVGPGSPLRIHREVVQAIRWGDGQHWAVRLSSGFADGPYHDWAFGIDLIGKVAGLYVPDFKKGED